MLRLRWLTYQYYRGCSFVLWKPLLARFCVGCDAEIVPCLFNVLYYVIW